MIVQSVTRRAAIITCSASLGAMLGTLLGYLSYTSLEQIGFRMLNAGEGHFNSVADMLTSTLVLKPAIAAMLVGVAGAILAVRLTRSHDDHS